MINTSFINCYKQIIKLNVQILKLLQTNIYLFKVIGLFLYIYIYIYIHELFCYKTCFFLSIYKKKLN